jgi:hypothetical protein
MQSEPNEKLEKLAYNISLAYELIDRVNAGRELNAMTSTMSFGLPSIKPHAEKSAQLQDEYTQTWIIGDQRYKDAISTLQTEFGNIDSVQDILRKVYQTCPSLRPKAPSEHTESVI